MGGFHVVDYVVFAGSIALSLGVGLASMLTGQQTHSLDEFYFGNRRMNVVALALSLTATFVSGIGVLGATAFVKLALPTVASVLLGTPSEVYHHGLSFMLFVIGSFLCALIAVVFLVPFYYNLGLKSMYEYFELRFNRILRRFAAVMFVVNMFLYMAMVLYAPALVSSQVIVTGIVCTMYTALGGIRAVIWTDACQMIIMLGGILTIFIHGVISSGGPETVYEKNVSSGRLKIDFNPNPFLRQSFWTFLIGGIFLSLPYVLNQAAMQRYLSVKSEASARRIVLIQWPIGIIWFFILMFTGATMYAYYQGCDPRLAGRTQQNDQIVIQFVLDTVGYLHGLPGLFTAVLCSATLSTVSSGINSIVLVVMEDFIRTLKGSSAVRLSKALSVLVGVLTMGMAILISFVGKGLQEFSMSVEGICNGPLLGLFFCGMILPFCESKGATVGVIAGLAVTSWVGIGAMFASNSHSGFPLSADSCPSDFNVTLSPNITKDSSSWTNASFHEESNLDTFYKLSFHYYGVLGFCVTVIVASLVSLLTGGAQMSINVPRRFLLFYGYGRKPDVEKDVSHHIEYRDTNRAYHLVPLQENTADRKGTVLS